MIWLKAKQAEEKSHSSANFGNDVIKNEKVLERETSRQKQVSTSETDHNLADANYFASIKEIVYFQQKGIMFSTFTII